jgi:small neutral amino acid transporter SnatA (MarC family)
MMMAGPQIMSTIIFVTASKPVRLSAYFLAAVAIATIVSVTIVSKEGQTWRPMGDPLKNPGRTR